MNFRNVFQEFENVNIAVVGDVMLDKYTVGNVTRVSPEAPVPIVQLQKSFNCLGGAANVAVNIKALGATPILFSVIGNDKGGDDFYSELEKLAITSEFLDVTPDRPTTVKERVIGNNQQLVRIDSEVIHDISEEQELRLLANIQSQLEKGLLHAVILQDYNKGLLTKNVIEQVINLANAFDVPTFVDPKLKNFDAYKNATFFKPNLKELRDGLNASIDAIDPVEDVVKAERQLKSMLNNQFSLVTMSEHGMMLFTDENKHKINAHVRKIADVSGAGDTVIATLATVYSASMNPLLAAELANLAGGLVCESVGVVAVDKDNLLEEAQNKLTHVL